MKEYKRRKQMNITGDLSTAWENVKNVFKIFKEITLDAVKQMVGTKMVEVRKRRENAR